MTVEEFLGWNGGGHHGKLELIDGAVRAMAPASADHAIIQANLARLIGNHLIAAANPCRVGTEAPVIARLRPNRNVRVPDIVVTCAPPSTSKVFDTPLLIAEVLSPSNEDESWESVYALALLPSLKEIVVISSTAIQAYVHTRDATGNWPEEHQSIETLDGQLHLTAIDLRIVLADVYRGTSLSG